MPTHSNSNYVNPTKSPTPSSTPQGDESIFSKTSWGKLWGSLKNGVRTWLKNRNLSHRTIINPNYVKVKAPYAQHFNFNTNKSYFIYKSEKSESPSDKFDVFVYMLKNEDGEVLSIPSNCVRSK